jgi:hypothetical protein
VREEILPMLRADLIAGFQTREIFETLRQMETVTFSGLDARLSPPLQKLLHDTVAADDIGEEGTSLESARSCLRKLESDAAKRKIDELRARVKSAEREGHMEEALEWMAELGQLEREARRGSRESGSSGVVH